MNFSSELLGALCAYAELFHEYDRNKTNQAEYSRAKSEVLGIRRQLVDQLNKRTKLEEWENRILLEREDAFVGATRDRCRILLLLKAI